VIVGTVRGNKSDDTIFSGLDTATLAIRGANKSESSSSKSSKSTKVVTSTSRSKGKSPTYYDLAHYTTTHTDVGASGSIVSLCFQLVLMLQGFGQGFPSFLGSAMGVPSDWCWCG
jgi:hypothetical protein